MAGVDLVALGLRCCRSTGRALPASLRPRSWSRVRLGGGQRSTGRAMRARSRPRSWSRVRPGACHRQGFIRWGFDAPVNRPGDACQCQDLIHGHAGQRSTGRAVLASVKASIMAGRTTRAGQRWPDQDLDHGHGFALMRATVRASMPPVNRPGVCVCQRSRPHSWPGFALVVASGLCAGWCWPAQGSIMVTGSPWCVPPSGLHSLGLSMRRSTGRAMLARSRPRSWSRVRLGGGQRSTGRAFVCASGQQAGRLCVPAVNRPGVCVCQRSRPHSWPGFALVVASGQQAGRYLPDQGLDHGHGLALVPVVKAPPLKSSKGANSIKKVAKTPINIDMSKNSFII